MDLGRWQTVKSIVGDVLDSDPAARDSVITARCSGDQELESEVRALLAVETSKLSTVEQGLARVVVQTYAAGDEIAGYTVVEHLATSHMADVYRASDGQRDVAIKVLSHAQPERELSLYARLKHPNVADLFSFGTDANGATFLVLEFVDGSDIGTYCTAHALALRERLLLFCDVCSAVMEAHRQLVAHRDIKPSNVLVATDGTVKLLDFGIAKRLDADSDELTAPGDRALTVPYASPEQLSGDATSVQTDIYSLGVLLCTLLTGQLPYRHESPHELPSRILAGDVALPSSLASDAAGAVPAPLLRGDLDAIAARCMRTNPAERYGSAGELQADVIAYLDGRPVAAREGAWRYRAGKYLRRHRLAVLLTIIVCAVLVGLSIQALTSYREAVNQRDLAERRSFLYRELSNFLTDLFEEPNPDLGNRRDLTGIEILKLGSERIDAEIDDYQVRAAIFEAIGDTYLGMQLYTESREMQRLAVQNALRGHGPASKEVAVAFSELALAELGLSELAWARLHLRTALSVTDVADPGGNLEGNILANLGVLEYKLGNYYDAERWYQRALSIHRPQFGELHVSVVAAEHNLAELYAKTGRLERGIELFRSVLERRLEIYDPGHPRIASTMSRLGKALCRHGKVDEGLEHISGSIDIRQERFGPSGRSTLLGLQDAAVCLLHAERVSEAKEYLTRLAEVLQSGDVGKRNPAIRSAVAKYLGDVYRWEGNFDQADASYRDARELFAGQYGWEHFTQIEPLRGLVKLHLANAQPAAALPLAREALRLARLQAPHRQERARELEEQVLQLETRVSENVTPVGR